MSYGHTGAGKLSGKARGELDAAGFTPDEYAWFCETFVGHGFDYIERGTSHRSDWQTIKFRLSGRRVADHLLGTRIVGTGARLDPVRDFAAWTQWIVIDLDRERGDMPSLAERLERVTAALGVPSFVMRSSKTGGLHLYYRLRAPAPLYGLRGLHGGTGLVLDLLNAHGIPERKGWYEVYPRGQGRAGTDIQNRLRLPGGYGSALMDASLRTIHPHSAGGDADIPARLADLRFLRGQMERGEMRTVDVATWEARRRELWDAGAISWSPVTLPTSDSPVSVAETGQPLPDWEAVKASVPALWKNGLSGPGERNTACYALMLDCWRGWRPSESREVAEAAAVETVWRWLTDKHNGQSVTYSDDRATARRELEEMTARRFAQGRPKSTAYQPLPLDAGEALAVLDAADRFGTGPTLTTGDERFPTVPRLTFLRYLWLRTATAKAWLYTEADEAWGAAKAQGGAVQDHDRLVSEFLTISSRTFWPDPTRPVFIVDQPWVKLRNLKTAGHPLTAGYSEERWPAMKAMAESCGAFVRVRKRNTWAKLQGSKHGGEGFETPLLTLGSATTDDRVFACPEAAILALVPAAQIPVKYIRGKAKQESARVVASLHAGVPEATPPGVAAMRAQLEQARTNSAPDSLDRAA